LVFFLFRYIKRIRIIILTLDIEFHNENDPMLDIFADVTTLGQGYNMYILYAALGCCLYFLLIINFFGFSKNMGLLITVISRAKVSLFFFIIMFMLLLLGFSFAGYYIFGMESETFKSLPIAILTCFEMSVGGTHYQDMAKGNANLAPAFFVIFVILFYIILLNMFTSIVGVNYEETVETTEEDEREEKSKSVIEQIENELQRQFDNIVKSDIDVTEKMTASVTQYKQSVVERMPLVSRIIAKVISMKFVVKSSDIPDPDKDGVKITTQGMNEKEEHKEINKEEPAEIIEEEKKEDESNNSEAQENEGNKKSDLLKNFMNIAKVGKPADVVDDITASENALSVIEKNQVSLWMLTLEKILHKKSEHEFKIFDLLKKSSNKDIRIEFYPKEHLEDLSENVKDFIFSTKRSRVQIEAWNKASTKQKYEYWCGMDIFYSENYQAEAERDAIEKKGKALSKKRKQERQEDYENSLKLQKEQEINLKAENEAKKEEELKKSAEIKKEEQKPEEIKKEEIKKEDEHPSVIKLQKVDSVDPIKIPEEPTGSVIPLQQAAAEQEDDSMSISESDIQVDMGSTKALVPKQGVVTYKGMTQSPEYLSRYPKCVSSLQWEFWNDLKIAEKIEMWLFNFTGKQRVKIWTLMKFSEEGMKEYLELKGIDLKISQNEENIINIQNVWQRLNEIDSSKKKIYEDETPRKLLPEGLDSNYLEIYYKFSLMKRIFHKIFIYRFNVWKTIR